MGALVLPTCQREYMVVLLFIVALLFRRDISLVVQRGKLRFLSRDPAASSDDERG